MDKTRKISLTQGKFAIVDAEDFKYLNQWKWYFGGQGYAVRSIHFKKKDGNCSCRMARMHRIVNNTPDGLDTDHINHNKLDNRKANLRACAHAKNLQNQLKRSCKKSSKYKGVSWKNSAQKWQSCIHKDGKSIYLGIYHNEDEAARAYDKAAIEMFDEFAFLNDLGAA